MKLSLLRTKPIAGMEVSSICPEIPPQRARKSGEVVSHLTILRRVHVLNDGLISGMPVNHTVVTRELFIDLQIQRVFHISSARFMEGKMLPILLIG